MTRLRFVTILFTLVVFGACDDTDIADYAGRWTGTWVAVADSTDRGTSQWTIGTSGAVTGTDLDPGRNTTFNVVGTIGDDGRLTTMSTPSDGSGPASLNGVLELDGSRRLRGVLVWGVTPPLSYRYTFTRD